MSDAGRDFAGVPGEDFTIEDVRGPFPEELPIRPLGRPVDAEVSVPGSKSVTNRALVVAALAEGRSFIRNALFSEDSYWLMNALSRLGFDIRADSSTAMVEIQGHGGEIPGRDVDLSVGNAGTAARFLPPMLALGRGPYRVDGDPRMRERPVADLVEAMRGLGARVDYASVEGRLPLIVRGGGLPGGETTVEVSRSSQFLSGLLMAAPGALGPVILSLTGALVSAPYVGITTAVMREFGVEVSEAHRSYTVRTATYEARDYPVEPDASAASYFFAAAALTGGRVIVAGLGEGCSQGDLRFVEVLEQMGCIVDIRTNATEVRGPSRLRGVEADMNEISDTFITLAAIAPFATTPTTITGIAHTRHQETDRVSAVASELRRLGVEAQETEDSIRIIPSNDIAPAKVQTYGDHRIAMGFSLVGLVSKGVTISDPACVTKTFPGYFERLGEL